MEKVAHWTPTCRSATFRVRGQRMWQATATILILTLLAGSHITRHAPRVAAPAPAGRAAPRAPPGAGTPQASGARSPAGAWHRSVDREMKVLRASARASVVPSQANLRSILPGPLGSVGRAGNGQPTPLPPHLVHDAVPHVDGRRRRRRRRCKVPLGPRGVAQGQGQSPSTSASACSGNPSAGDERPGPAPAQEQRGRPHGW